TSFRRWDVWGVARVPEMGKIWEKPSAPPSTPALHRARCDLQDPRGVLHPVSEHVHEDEGEPLLDGEVLQGGVDVEGGVAAAGGVGGGPSAFVGEDVEGVVLGGYRGTDHPAAQPVVAGVDDDPVQPRADHRLAAERSEEHTS